MNYQWRDFVGSVVDGKYPLLEYLGDVAGNGVYSTKPMDGSQAIIRLMAGGTEDATRTLEHWQAATSLSHPHVARTYAAGETEVIGNTVVFTVTERPDDNLVDAIRNRPLNEDEARTLTESMLSALAYLHKKTFAHRAVAPDNIVAMGDKIKLAPWSIAPASVKERSNDIFAAGQTIAEVLTQKRPTGEATLPRNLPEPFQDVARACLRKTVEATEALRMLTAPADAPIPVKRTYKVPTAAIVAASVLVLALVWMVRSYRSEEPSAPTTTSASSLPSPVTENVRARTVPEAPARVASSTPAPSRAAAVPARTTTGTTRDWVLVAEIYKQHELAVRHAEKMGERWRQFQPEVYPPAPGGNRYMVVVASADTRKEAEDLLDKARAAGMPSRVYLTKLKR
jgi:serine/threonine protein kinase